MEVIWFVALRNITGKHVGFRTHWSSMCSYDYIADWMMKFTCEVADQQYRNTDIDNGNNIII